MTHRSVGVLLRYDVSDGAVVFAQFGQSFELIDHLREGHRMPSGALQHFVYCHCVVH